MSSRLFEATIFSFLGNQGRGLPVLVLMQLGGSLAQPGA